MNRNINSGARRSPLDRLAGFAGVVALIVGVLLAAVALGACSAPASAEDPAPVVVEQPAEPDPATEADADGVVDVEPEPVVTTEPAAEWDSSTPENTRLILDLTWEQTDEQSRGDICWGVNNVGADWAADELISGLDMPVDRPTVITFFEEVC